MLTRRSRSKREEKLREAGSSSSDSGHCSAQSNAIRYNPAPNLVGRCPSTAANFRMIDHTKLRLPWRYRESCLHDMLDCGDRGNDLVANALKFLPDDVLASHCDNLVIISTLERDACRVARHYCENRELIILSERIFPPVGVHLDAANGRYFVFAVLHEVAHATRKHQSPKFDELSRDQARAQEHEADAVALEWFNSHVEAWGNPHMKPITIDEVDQARAESFRRREA